MSTRLKVLLHTVFLCALVALPGWAQEPAASGGSTAAPANLAYIEGAVTLVHEGAADRATVPAMLVDGDIVRTQNGRAELVFADGTLVHLDHDTELEVLSSWRLRLVDGRVMVRVSAAATGAYVIDTQSSPVKLVSRGEYGVTADSRLSRLDVTVARGLAEIDDAGTELVVHGGEMATIAGIRGRALVQAFNSAQWDTFARWSNDRTNGFSSAASSSRLPVELRAYGGVLDYYGRWDYISPYGNVWIPAVGASWRPYYTGSWSHTRYGWTWIGSDPWTWPTHHYGRWGFNGAIWYWIPGNAWGPAWVSWGFVPGYVSWCPLGFDGRPVFGFWNRPDHPAYWPNYGPNYDPWRGWTILPRDRFGGRQSVRVHAIDPSTLPESTRRTMIVQNSPPPSAAGAVPRGTLSNPTARGTQTNVVGAVPRQGAEGPRPGAVRSPRAGIYPPSTIGNTVAAPPASATDPAPEQGAVPRSTEPPAASRPAIAPPESDVRYYAPRGAVRNPRATTDPPPSVVYPPTTTSTSSTGAVPRPGMADRPSDRRGDDGGRPAYVPPQDHRPQGERGGASAGAGRARESGGGGGATARSPGGQSSGQSGGSSSTGSGSGSGAGGGGAGARSGSVRRPPPQ